MTAPDSTDYPAGSSGSQDLEILKLEVEIWKKAVEVQQHFNDIALRIRSLAMPVLVGVIGFAGYIVKEQGNYPFALAVIVAGMVGWSGFFLMDRYWYHIFLRAAALHAGQIESRLAARLPSIGLTTVISTESRSAKIPRWVFGGKPVVLHSRQRLERFYQLGLSILALVGAVIAMLWIIKSATGSP